MNVVDVSAVDSGRLISAKPGQIVAIHLDENPTTGFQWTAQVDREEVWHIAGTSFTSGATQQPGAAGTRTWRLQAVQPGRARVVFELRRSWNKEQVARHLVFDLVAEQ